MFSFICTIQINKKSYESRKGTSGNVERSHGAEGRGPERE
jgi:hypothetical protein